MVVQASERAEIVAMYQESDLSTYAIAAITGRCRQTVSRIVAGMDRHGKLLPDRRPFRREHLGPPRPADQPRLDMLLMRDLRHTGRRIWWPGVSDRCKACGGRLSLYPPSDGALGWLSCSACSREPYEVAM